MTAMEPMALFGLEVPAGDVAILARGDIPATFRITMAAIDPNAEPEGDADAVPRATLKIIRHSLLEEDDDDNDEDFDVDQMERLLNGDEDDDEDDEDDDEDDEDDEDLVGGPSDPAKSKKARKQAALSEILKLAQAADLEEDEEIPNGVNGTKKSAKSLGKMPVGDDDDEDEDDDEEDDYDVEAEEFVLCTLDPARNYQQPLDITIGEDERVLFKVTGTHSIFLTGNYVEPAGRSGLDDYDEDDDEDDYDLEPDSDEELDYDEEDELDGLEDPRIMEIDDEEEAPALVKATKKGKNKRPAEEEEDVSGLDALITKAKKDVVADEEQKLSKKQLKKQKKNDGSAAVTAEEKKDAELGSAKSDKKVQFAKQLEQGPTPTKDGKDKPKASLGVKKVQGVTIDDKKLGTGPAAKSGDRVGMRYIGKLEKNNHVFDSNKKGKPFTFKLGAGEVIKGWDIGIAGMSVGGERRITIPANLAYGSKANGEIPGNSTLIFDVKLLEIKGR